MIKSKFKCAEKVWFWDVDKPISMFVYQISETPGGIWYVLTPKAYYFSTAPYYVDEYNLYSSKKELLSQRKKSSTLC